MAININPTNINPNIGDAYAMAYRSRMNYNKPHADLYKNILKDAGDFFKFYYLNDDRLNKDSDDEVLDVNEQLGRTEAITKPVVEETDVRLINSGLDPKLYNQMNRAKEIDEEAMNLFNSTKKYRDMLEAYDNGTKQFLH